MKNKVFILLTALAAAFVITSCGSANSCERCGATPTKAFVNAMTQEKEYYCKDCYSECAFCSQKATEYYTSALGIVFVCPEHYEYILEINS